MPLDVDADGVLGRDGHHHDAGARELRLTCGGSLGHVRHDDGAAVVGTPAPRAAPPDADLRGGATRARRPTSSASNRSAAPGSSSPAATRPARCPHSGFYHPETASRTRPHICCSSGLGRCRSMTDDQHEIEDTYAVDADAAPARLRAAGRRRRGARRRRPRARGDVLRHRGPRPSPAAGITLRRRTGGTDAGWHLKLPDEEGPARGPRVAVPRQEDGAEVAAQPARRAHPRRHAAGRSWSSAPSGTCSGCSTGRARSWPSSATTTSPPRLLATPSRRPGGSGSSSWSRATRTGSRPRRT